MNIEDFERQIVNALLAGDDPLLETLRAQYKSASVKSREVEDEGFTTYFDVPKDMPLVDRKHLHLDDLQVELEGKPTPVDTALEIRDGRLRSLQVSAYEGGLPESPEITSAWYYGTKKYPGITDALIGERELEELLEEE